MKLQSSIRKNDSSTLDKTSLKALGICFYLCRQPLPVCGKEYLNTKFCLIWGRGSSSTVKKIYIAPWKCFEIISEV